MCRAMGRRALLLALVAMGSCAMAAIDPTIMWKVWVGPADQPRVGEGNIFILLTKARAF